MDDPAAPAPEPSGAPWQRIHGSCVALDGRAVLIEGPSGSGKSALALELLAFGAGLVADDQVILTRQAAGRLRASCPPRLLGLIEARSVGILRASPVLQADLALIVDLSQEETLRLPPLRHCERLGVPIDLVFVSKASHFAASVLQYLRAGRSG